MEHVKNYQSLARLKSARHLRRLRFAAPMHGLYDSANNGRGVTCQHAVVLHNGHVGLRLFDAATRT